jgi:hypothetical protein
VFISPTPETNSTIAVLSDFHFHLHCFEGRVLCELYGKVFLALHHKRDCNACSIDLFELKNVATQLAAFDCCARTESSPLDHKAVLRDISAHETRERPNLSQYAALIGSLMYTASCSRPDQLPDHCSPFRCGLRSCPTRGENT